MVDQNSSNLDTLETSITVRPPESYRKYCIENCSDEYQASIDSYKLLDEENGTDRVDTLEHCRTAAHFCRNIKTGKVKVLSSSCHLRWCPMCSATRRWFLAQQVSDWLQTTKQPKFLTLTLVHSDLPLNTQIENLYCAFRKYRKLKFFKGNVKGGVWFFQIHRATSDGRWHPHLHCVIDSPWLDKYALSQAWEFVTGDSKIINIKEVKDSDSMAEYVARYSARPSLLSKMDVPSRHELLLTLHGRRLVGTWGCARSIVLRPSKPPDADDWINVGYFSRVVKHLETDPQALSIWRAYKTDSVLPENISCLDCPDETTANLEFSAFTVLEHEQMYLDFW